MPSGSGRRPAKRLPDSNSRRSGRKAAVKHERGVESGDINRMHRKADTRPATARRDLELRTLQGFRTIFASARAHDAEIRRSASISGSQLWALSEIAQGDGLTINGLSARMARHQTTASNLANALSARRLIRRARDGTDQRIVHLHVSPEGRRLLQEAPGPQPGLLVDAIRHLRTAQLEQLCAGLSQLIAAMRRTATEAAGETLLGE